MKNIVCAILLMVIGFSSNSQNVSNINNGKIESSRPKLVVGIVVDQMRYDYLTRFYNKYGNGGFKRMMSEGFNCKNNHFNYVPTYTGPGHASVYTGTTPKYHGVIANDWYDKEIKSKVYCASDNSVNPVGTTNPSGKMSPRRMLSTTFADENRIFTQMKGKTIGISIKDRGSILPAGHTANAAYWFDYEHNGTGNWISSSFYMDNLPKWVQKFNDSKKAESYFKVWDTYYDIDTYTESGPDSNSFEKIFNGKETPTFPYDLKELKKTNGNYNIIVNSPYGNSLTTDFAIEAIEAEELGKDDITDVLALSYSSTDKVGHEFGVNSKEIEDVYIRLDKDLERLFTELDAQVGKGEYTVFLTADHGAVHVPNYLRSLKIPAGYVVNSAFRKKLDAFALETFNIAGLIENVSNNQIFLNREKIKEAGLNLAMVQESIVDEIISYEEVYKAYTAETMNNNSFSYGIEHALQNGYNQKRSGDILMVSYPGHIYYRKTGTTHGAGFNYDTHVPLLFFGKGIKHGETVERTVITDIAPTMSALLGISFPNASTGSPLEFVIENE